MEPVWKLCKKMLGGVGLEVAPKVVAIIAGSFGIPVARIAGVQ
jgi:hypothetical protein